MISADKKEKVDSFLESYILCYDDCLSRPNRDSLRPFNKQ